MRLPEFSCTIYLRHGVATMLLLKAIILMVGTMFLSAAGAITSRILSPILISKLFIVIIYFCGQFWSRKY